MRITKKAVRQVKEGLLRRIGQLAILDDEALEKEFARCFPLAGQDAPAFLIGKRRQLMADAIERSFPLAMTD